MTDVTGNVTKRAKIPRRHPRVNEVSRADLSRPEPIGGESVVA